MAYDLSVLDNFLSDPFSPFTDSSSHEEIYQSLQQSLTNSVDGGGGITNSIENLASELLSSSSSSPPSHQLENLSLHHNQSFHPNALDSDLDFSANAMMEVKTEEFHHHQVPFEFETISFLLQSSVNNNNNNNAVKLMQRSYSSNSFEDNNKPNFMFKPPPPNHHHHLDSVLESPTNYYWPLSSSSSSQVLDSPHHAQIRRVCSTGDLQKMKRNETRNVLSSSPLSTEGCSLMEEPNFKVGRYSAEERKERIHRYRAKRTQRNFNKTIKYACRKTLADNRPRIRGRFARNDEAVEIPKTAMFNRYEDEDDLWIDGYNEEEEEEGRTMGRALFYSSSYDGITQPQYQYYSY